MQPLVEYMSEVINETPSLDSVTRDLLRKESIEKLKKLSTYSLFRKMVHVYCLNTVQYLYGDIEQGMAKINQTVIQWNLSVTTTSIIRFNTCD